MICAFYSFPVVHPRHEYAADAASAARRRASGKPRRHDELSCIHRSRMTSARGGKVGGNVAAEIGERSGDGSRAGRFTKAGNWLYSQ